MAKKRKKSKRKAPIVDDPKFKKPALRISNLAYGRQSDGRRVKYLIDPDGLGSERAIAEQVVLRRWRQRELEGYAFSGARLSPTIWRALPVVLGPDCSRWASYSSKEIGSKIRATASDRRARHLAVPNADILVALFKVCKEPVLFRLVRRHKDFAPKRKSGVPDLFLFARDSKGKIRAPRFVEVKKPYELLSDDQKDEIGFMQKQQLKARVFRLAERCTV